MNINGKKLLELSCCKKQQKKSPNQETGVGNRGLLEALNDTKLILNDLRGSLILTKDQLGIIKMSPIPQTSFLVETFFVVSYSKPALARINLSEFLLQWQLPLGCKSLTCCYLH